MCSPSRRQSIPEKVKGTPHGFRYGWLPYCRFRWTTSQTRLQFPGETLSYPPCPVVRHCALHPVSSSVRQSSLERPKICRTGSDMDGCAIAVSVGILQARPQFPGEASLCPPSQAPDPEKVIDTRHCGSFTDNCALVLHRVNGNDAGRAAHPS